MSKKLILLVEHDLFIQDMYIKMLGKNYEVVVASSAQDAVDVLDTRNVDLVISETQLGANNGIEILHEMRSYEDWLAIPLILTSTLPKNSYPGYNDWSTYGVSGFLYKPHLSENMLNRAVREALSQSNRVFALEP